MKAYALNFNQLHQWGWNRIIRASELSEESLQILRFVLPALYILFYMPDYNLVARIPDAWFDPAPLSIAAPFQSFPTLLFFQITQTLLVVCALALMWGHRPRFFGLMFCALHLLITSFEYSVGKIDHVAHLFLLCFFCLSLGNWGSPITKNSYTLPIPCSTLLAVLLAFGMFTAGFEKSLKWIDFDTNTSGFLSWYFSGYYNLGRDELLAPAITQLPRICLELMDYSAVAFEMSPFICLLLGKRYWVAWCAIACTFHAGTTVLLNISFPYQIFGYLPFLIPAFLLANLGNHAKHFSFIILAICSYRTAIIWADNCPLLRDVLLPTDLTKLYFDLCVWVSLAAIGAYHAYTLHCLTREPSKQTSPMS